MAHEFLRVVLHVVEHLLDGLALKHLVDAILAILDGNMDGIGVAEQVVEVTENLLTSSLRHPKILIKEFSYFLMPCHQHGLRINLLV